MQVLASQLHFLANKNAELVIPPLFWPVNCIKIGGHVALLSDPTVYPLYCAEKAYEISYFGKENNGKKDSAFKPAENAGTILNAVVENIIRLSSKQRMQLATYVYSFIAENDLRLI